jgi:hypothetical protein
MGTKRRVFLRLCACPRSIRPGPRGTRPWGERALTNGATGDTIPRVASVADILAQMRRSPSNVRFSDACRVATELFGEPRQKRSSHCVWKMPWAGDPRINLQNEHGKAKRYQVEQLIQAIDRKSEEAQK